MISGLRSGQRRRTLGPTVVFGPGDNGLHLDRRNSSCRRALHDVLSVWAHRPPNRENPVELEPHPAAPSAAAGRWDRLHPDPRPQRSSSRDGARGDAASLGAATFLLQRRGDDVLTDDKSIAICAIDARL